MRLSKLLKMNSQWMAEFDINVDTVRLLKLLAPVMIIAHYVGCFWFYMSADRDADDAWWGNLYFEDPDSILSKYIASIYWAITTMTTVGFGDIVPVNDLEKAYCILVLIGGTTLFAYVVGTVIEVASNSKSLMNREHEMVQRVNAYIKERGVSTEFIVACQEHLRFVDSERRSLQRIHCWMLSVILYAVSLLSFSMVAWYQRSASLIKAQVVPHAHAASTRATILSGRGHPDLPRQPRQWHLFLDERSCYREDTPFRSGAECSRNNDER